MDKETESILQNRESTELSNSISNTKANYSTNPTLLPMTAYSTVLQFYAFKLNPSRHKKGRFFNKLAQFLYKDYTLVTQL